MGILTPYYRVGALVGVLLFFSALACGADRFTDLDSRIGPQDAVVLATPEGTLLYKRNAHQRLIPASTLKLLTALSAIHYLTPEYRFTTEFYLDQQQNLAVKGYGDPLFISEVMQAVATSLRQRASRFNDLVLDDHYFEKPVVIPGRSPSFQPYDAPIGALSSNFNTVNFTRRNGRYVSAEAQTPLVPFARAKLMASGIQHGRITLSHTDNDITMYTGHLLRHFLEQNGIDIDGQIRLEGVDPVHYRLLYTHQSPFDLLQVVAKMLEFSNNFMANQLVLACGAKQSGPPGTLAKGVRALKSYARDELGLGAVHVVEGSGLSRRNRLSAHAMLTIIRAFTPYHHLMRQSAQDYYKTGTLKGIRTRIGFIRGPKAQLYPYVILFNAPGKVPQTLVKRLHAKLNAP